MADKTDKTFTPWGLLADGVVTQANDEKWFSGRGWQPITQPGWIVNKDPVRRRIISPPAPEVQCPDCGALLGNQWCEKCAAKWLVGHVEEMRHKKPFIDLDALTQSLPAPPTPEMHAKMRASLEEHMKANAQPPHLGLPLINQSCELCKWTNVGLLKVAGKWTCHGCIDRAITTLQRERDEANRYSEQSHADWKESHSKLLDASANLRAAESRAEAAEKKLAEAEKELEHARPLRDAAIKLITVIQGAQQAGSQEVGA